MVSNARRIARNSAMMYVRMFVTMLISLYTSRVVLQTLGVEDYGTYCLVGSIVALFSSLRTLFASSTQRFLNFEMGRCNYEKLQGIFNMSLMVNFIIAIVFIVAVEIVGVWFLNYKINIDPSRIDAAKIVFQSSVVTATLSLLTTAYDAVLISHERLNIYAIFSMAESLLKLGVVLLLPFLHFDKLISYSIMLVIVACVIRLMNVLYCKLNFQECKFSFEWDSNRFKEMTSFAWWNFLGNTAYSLTHNGIGMVMNVFGGTLVNAANGIAYNINSIAEQFINNIVVVINPYTIKTYSNGEHEKFYRIIFASSKILFSVQICLTLPIVFMTYRLLSLWLGEVPQYSVIFVQLLLVNTQIRSLHQSLDTIFKSLGRLREYQLIENIILSMSLFLSYVFLKGGAPYYTVFLAIIIVNVFAMICVILLANKIAHLPLWLYIKNVIFPCLFCLIASGFLYYLKSCLNINNILDEILYTLVSLCIVQCCMLLYGFSKADRMYLWRLIKKKKN